MKETDEMSDKSDRVIRKREKERKEKLTPQAAHPQAEHSPLQDAQSAQVHGDMMIFNEEPFLSFLSFFDDDARGALALGLQIELFSGVISRQFNLRNKEERKRKEGRRGSRRSLYI